MPRSHHRKKHKEQLRQFKHNHESAGSSSVRKGKLTTLFTFIGAATGFAISYFAAGANIVWIAISLLAGAVAGYFIGRKMDSE